MNMRKTVAAQKNPLTMKNIYTAFIFLLASLAGYAQMYNAGGNVRVENGASLVIEGNYSSSGTGTIEIDGTVQLKGDFINNDNGTVAVGSTGLLIFNGTSAQDITGDTSTTFYCAVEINNASAPNDMIKARYINNTWRLLPPTSLMTPI